MVNHDKPKSGSAFWKMAAPTLASVKGNILVYLVIVFLIFGVLGITIAALFQTTTTSTATPNDTRRADYMREAGMRYAMSEMRNSKFLPAAIKKLNATTYKPAKNHTFTVNVFSPWYEASADYSSGGTITLKVPQGKLPDNYTVPTGVWVVNFNYTSQPAPFGTETARVTGFSIDPANNRLDLTLSNDFIANEDEPVCLAVQISNDQTVNEGENLYVALEARDIFPRYNGAVSILRRNYTYETRVDEPVNNRVMLQNLKASTLANRESPEPFPLDITRDREGGGDYDGDFVILSPLNHVIIPSGKAGDVTVPGTHEEGVNVYDPTTINPMSRAHIDAEELTSNFQSIDDSDFLKVDTFDNTIDVGGGAAGSDFGGGWYSGSKSIGGNADFCVQGRCTTNLGLRVFFTLEYSGDGDGLTFALINGQDNSIFSAGGDIELSELMGYGGDSRTVADGSAFLANSVENQGLDPPKIALEFDMRPNNASTIYCNGSAANLNTRNDPLSGNKDAVQFVFWRKNPVLNIGCRDNHPSYDDNRHGPLEWKFEEPAGEFAFGRPAIGSDGAIYVSVVDDGSFNKGKIYGIRPDGTAKWADPAEVIDNADYMPGIDPANDTLYTDISGNSIRAIDAADGSTKTGFAASGDFFVNSDVDTTPIVDQSGNVYFGTDENGVGGGQVFGVDSTGVQIWLADLDFPLKGIMAFSLDAGQDRVFAAMGYDSIGWRPGQLWALNRTGPDIDRIIWYSQDRLSFSDAPLLQSSPAVDPIDGTIYVGSDDNHLYAIQPDDGNSDGEVATKWTYFTGNDVLSSPAVDQNNETVYVGSNDNFLHAVDRAGNLKWKFPDPVLFPAGTGDDIASSPIVDSTDGTIYVGSRNNIFYAVNPDGTERWNYPTGDDIRSSPTIGNDGNIYIGSDDSTLYAFAPFKNPRNERDGLITAEGLGPDITVAGESAKVDNSGDGDDWLKGAPSNPAIGPWAVRMEVLRSTTANANGKYQYTLRTWLRQCDTTCSAVLGTYFEDTRVEYNAKAPHLAQTFELTAAEHSKFSTFLFGFTGAVASGESQTAIIDRFKLSFIGADDQIIISDPSWP